MSTNSEPTPIGMVGCTTCHQVVECSAADVATFLSQGWPKCCNEVMTYYATSEKPHLPRWARQ
ncbi:unnamed protein product [Gemmata massiliana]|uniref:Uncharacterized protein n=1 Tax=Gemmata massiliana TaxID=1210884 RepID=A0A6P2CUG8_9BACT|nr:unnamed protein product [Gemmata massiliana]